ncbi:MAG: IscS subfamily cysteine desulfurase [Deltaproteobacteria bacterium]|nr:IscS subfamily cysteine desulfurase [Deltaproteobacteria bacterium]
MANELPFQTPVYLDNSSTTRCDPRVVEEMLPYFSDTYGNAHSRSHAYGWGAEKAVDLARERVASLVNCKPSEIIFTSGGTESCNLAIFGAARMYAEKGKHIVTTAVEHRSCMDPCRALEREGFEVTYLPVDTNGLVTAEQVAGAIREDTILVSVIFGNNEVGTIMPAKEIGAVCKDKGVIFHLDACLGLDTETLDVDADGIDLLSMSGHKMYGPQGIGALYVRRRRPRVRLRALNLGGGQERGFRHGTLNVPGIVGMGKAAEICKETRDAEKVRQTALSKRLKDAFFAQMDHLYLNGHPTQRLPGLLNISFNYIEGESLMMGMSTLAVSSGSACTSATLEPSHVMRALGVGEDLVHTSIRFSLGRFTTEAEVDFAAKECLAAAHKLREMSPLYEMVKEGIDLNTIEWKHD